MSWFDRFIKRKQPPSATAASDTSSAYYNPIDQKTYLAEGGWTTHTPASTSRISVPDTVRLQHVRLLSSEQMIAANVPLERLTLFLKTVEAQVKAHLSGSTSAFELLLQCTLFPNQAPQHQMATQGTTNDELLQQVYDALVVIEPLQTREDSISFQMHFVILPSGK